MLKLFKFLPVVVLSVGVPVVAAPPAQAPRQSAQSNNPPTLDPNRKICRTEDLIGSRTGGSKICKTAAQWEAERKQNGGDQE